MPIEYSISRWTDRVASGQWRDQDRRLRAAGTRLPPVLGEIRALGEVHRLDLALFVVFEEASLRVSGALVRRAPHPEALAFGAQQTLDEARHHELFRARLMLTGPRAAESLEAIVTPPLRRFLDRCFEVADGGAFVDALTLMNLVLEGMAYPLYSYERRYWAPVDPYLAELVHSAYADETRHVAYGAALVRALLDDDPAARARVKRLCDEARRALGEVFRHYVKRFVGLFDAVARRHGELFAGAELAPGLSVSRTPYREQVELIERSIEIAHGRLLARAGLA
jgi:hypothetical protein